MAVRIRLSRVGRPKQAVYRIIAIDSRKKRDGKPIEVLGHYDPKKDKDKIKLNYERYSWWLKVGAQPSETVSSLVKKLNQQTTS
ncbi:MAG: 30S ribosomal protein S16 [Endomicrobiia bacterium]